jgi:hypothetical protein
MKVLRSWQISMWSELDRKQNKLNRLRKTGNAKQPMKQSMFRFTRLEKKSIKKKLIKSLKKNLRKRLSKETMLKQSFPFRKTMLKNISTQIS